jgi:hypothetical protein
VIVFAAGMVLLFYLGWAVMLMILIMIFYDLIYDNLSFMNCDLLVPDLPIFRGSAVEISNNL